MKGKLREMYENGLRGIEPSISANGLLKAVANGWITTEDAVEIPVSYTHLRAHET